ncbi:hypothetical protein CcI6DRAFT_02388 [Frankia sp. CcI6]|nr:hypothetical protein CcI6DRAFT_02388 [Frankia sp. CcI6]KDA42896.1 hypothetical protein BMG523Draft_02285 [Frankia sp. BMG5.23]
MPNIKRADERAIRHLWVPGPAGARAGHRVTPPVSPPRVTGDHAGT